MLRCRNLDMADLRRMRLECGPHISVFPVDVIAIKQNAQTRMVDPTQVPDPLPDWLREEDLAVYVEAFRAAGFTGPLNWYRNFHRNFELTAAWSGLPITIPSLSTAPPL